MRLRATLLFIVASCTSANPRYVGDAAAPDDMAREMCGRTCPARSMCSSGYCSPPAPELGTQIGQRCDASAGPQQLQCVASFAAGLTCQPFVDVASHELRWYCDSHVGTGTAGTQCSSTSGSKCRSGICASTNTCFEACQQTTECAGTLACRDVQITVEGVGATVKSCAP
jgi:hypothetical protein